MPSRIFILERRDLWRYALKWSGSKQVITSVPVADTSRHIGHAASIEPNGLPWLNTGKPLI